MESCVPLGMFGLVFVVGISKGSAVEVMEEMKVIYRVTNISLCPVYIYELYTFLLP